MRLNGHMALRHIKKYCMGENHAPPRKRNLHVGVPCATVDKWCSIIKNNIVLENSMHYNGRMEQSHLKKFT